MVIFGGLVMKFDAYAATIRDQDMKSVAVCLADSLGGIVSKGKPMRRYSETLNIDTGQRMAAWIGVQQDTGLIYLEGKGETTPELVKVLREHYPVHTTPRIDVAEDFNDPGAFNALQDLIRKHKGPRVKGGYVALPDDVEDGKTWAAGVRGGVAYLRVYEAGKHPDRLHLQLPYWVRAEVEMRPHYAKDKEAAATMSPLDVWGLTAWTHNVGQALTQVPINRYEPEIRKYSHDKTTYYIANTFRRHLEEMLANGEHFEATFRDCWRDADKLNRRH